MGRQGRPPKPNPSLRFPIALPPSARTPSTQGGPSGGGSPAEEAADMGPRRLGGGTDRGEEGAADNRSAVLAPLLS